MAVAAVDLSTSTEDQAMNIEYPKTALHHVKGLKWPHESAPAWACSFLFVPYSSAATADVASPSLHCRAHTRAHRIDDVSLRRPGHSQASRGRATRAIVEHILKSLYRQLP